MVQGIQNVKSRPAGDKSKAVILACHINNGRYYFNTEYWPKMRKILRIMKENCFNVDYVAIERHDRVRDKVAELEAKMLALRLGSKE